MSADRIRVQEEKKRKVRKEEINLPDDVADAIDNGKLFIPLERRLKDDEIPDGFMMQTIQLGRDQYMALLPERIMRYIGFPEESTDELSECYTQIRDFENQHIKKKHMNAAESYFAHNVKSSYETYVLNLLLDGGGNLKPSYEALFEKERKTLDAMLSILGCKTKTALKDLEDVLVHRTPMRVKMVVEVPKEIEKEVDVYGERQVTRRISCDVGSHYEWRNQTTTEHVKVGTKTVKETIYHNEVVDRDTVIERTRQYHEFEGEMVKKLSLDKVSESDSNLGKNILRTYLNLHLEKAKKTHLPLDTDKSDAYN